MGILLALSAEAEPEVTLDAALETLMEALVRPSTLAVVVYSFCSGMRHNYPSGDLRVMKSLRISTMDAPTQMVGEPPSPNGLTILATSRMHSGICNVCTVRFVPLNTTLKAAFSVLPTSGYQYHHLW